MSAGHRQCPTEVIKWQMTLTVLDTAPRERRLPLSTPTPAHTCLSGVTLAVEDWMDTGSVLEEDAAPSARPPLTEPRQHGPGADPRHSSGCYPRGQPTVTRGHDGGRARSRQAASGQAWGVKACSRGRGRALMRPPSAHSLAALWQGEGG